MSNFMNSTGGRSAPLDVDPSKQWDWHEAHRDMARNHYRTSYTDMIHWKEVTVKSDYPSGYGGHIPSLRHDMLFRNTAFDRNLVLRRNDPSRDAHPSFKDHIAGVPTVCAKPQGAKKNPTYGVVPHDGTTGTPIAPWAVVQPVRGVPNFRSVPATLARTRSLPGLGGGRNQAAVSVGAQMALPTQALSPTQGMSQFTALQAPQVPSSPDGADRLHRMVSIANAEANQGAMPSDEDVIMGELGY